MHWPQRTGNTPLRSGVLPTRILGGRGNRGRRSQKTSCRAPTLRRPSSRYERSRTLSESFQVNSKDIDKYCQSLMDILDDETRRKNAFRRAGELVQSVLQSLAPGREPPERTRAFTKALVEAAGRGEERTATTSRVCGTVTRFSDILGWGFIRGEGDITKSCG